MNYIITRTSGSFLNEEKPIECAVMDTIVYSDVRTCSEEYFDKTYSKQESWRSKGYGHSVNDKGHIVRYNTREEWVIGINTLDELNEFIENVGECVITKNDAMSTPKIEIYDDYRE